MRKMLLGLFVLFVFSGASWAKDKIAVFQFNGVRDDYNVTYVAEEQMVSLLVNQKRFDVIERKQLQAIMEEQAFSQSGAINDGDAVKIGKIAGIKYCVLGSVTNVNYSRRQVYNEYSQKYQWEVDALIVLQIKIVDVQTAGIIFSETFNMKPGGGGLGSLFSSDQGDASLDADSTLSSMVKRTYEKEITKKMSNTFPIQGSVISVDGKEVTIDLGSGSGVEEGMKFDVIYQEEKEHPKTKKKIIIEKKIGVLQVKEVSGEESAICKIKEGTEIAEGDIIKLQKKK